MYLSQRKIQFIVPGSFELFHSFYLFSQTKMKYSIVLLVAALSAVSAQIYLQQPIAYALQQPAPVQQSHAHPAVIRNAQAESEWPTELLKSHRFYSNPNTAAALAKSSWFTNEEMPVANREAEKIPRESIFKIINSAGLHRRR